MRLLFLMSVLFGAELHAKESRKAPLFVSLGSHCEVFHCLKESGLVKKRYPFDCIRVLNQECLIRILDEDFNHFLEEHSFISHPFHPGICANARYEVEFDVDFDSSFSDSWASFNRLVHQVQRIQPRFQRRIERFRKLSRFGGRVFFIRTAFDFDGDLIPLWGEDRHAKITTEQAFALRRALDRYFPTLDFTLVIVNHAEVGTPLIRDVDGIIEFRIRRTHKCEDYKRLFKILEQRSFKNFNHP